MGLFPRLGSTLRHLHYSYKYTYLKSGAGGRGVPNKGNTETTQNVLNGALPNNRDHLTSTHFQVCLPMRSPPVSAGLPRHPEPPRPGLTYRCQFISNRYTYNVTFIFSKYWACYVCKHFLSGSDLQKGCCEFYPCQSPHDVIQIY